MVASQGVVYAQDVIEQRKTVSVVFADLVESSSLAEGLDPERLSLILRRYFDSLRGVVEAHGGRVEKFIGDAVVGIFGVPVLHEDDALRAVRAGLGMQEQVRALNAEVGSGLGAGLRIRVGVNTGQVVVSAENALGHAISMAARLEQNASPGDVLIGKETFALVEAAVDAEPVDDLSVKGSSQPVAAWRVTGLREVAPRGWHSAGAFVGRERELGQMADAFESARSQASCMTVTVVAQPGLGKSRLLAEVASRLSSVTRVISGLCPPYGEGITYAPLIDAIAQLEAAEGADVLDRLVSGESDGDEVVARVRATMSGAASGSPDETAWAFRRLFDTLAAERPLLVILDDMHWADPLLLDLVEYVGTFSVGRPILLLCAARPDLLDARPAWAAPRPNTQQVRLAPLTSAQTEKLLAGIDSERPGGGHSDDETRRRIVETSGGVPLFAEQLAAFDADNGERSLVPPTIRALLAARVDRLPPEQRAVLEHAAIVGQTFRRDELAGLMPSEARSALGAQLMSLIRRDFIRVEQAADGRDTFGFSHALMRDAVHEQMPRRSRAELHERYAALLETNGGAQAELIGHHLEQAYRERSALGESGGQTADLGRRAGHALAAAGRKATARKESIRAVDLLTRASELLAGDPELRVRVLPDLLDALVAEPDFDAADSVHEEAVSLAREVGDVTSELRAEMAWSVGEARRDASGWQERTIALTDRAVDHFRRLGDDGSTAQALLLRAIAIVQTDQFAAIDMLKQAHAHALRTDDERIQVEAWDELGGAMLFGPTPYAEILEFTTAEVEWAREHGISFTAADGRLGEVYALAALGEFDAALSLIDELTTFFAQLPGHVTQHGECFTIAGRIERDRGNPAAAAAHYRRAMELFDKGGSIRWWRNAAPGVAHALLDMGHIEDAQHVLAEIEARDDPDDSRPTAFRLEAEARYQAAIGDAERGVELARQAVDAVADSGALFYEGRARDTLADLLASSGDVASARVERDRARSLYEAKGYLPGIARIDGIGQSSSPGLDPRAVVEDAQAYLVGRGSVVIEDLGDVVLRHVPFSPHYWYGAAVRPRFSDSDADQRIKEVRDWFRDRGREEFIWMVGESATPADLVDRLIASGAHLDDEDPIALSMILDHEPPPGPPDIEIRRISTFEEFSESARITMSDAPPEAWAATEANLPAAWAEAREFEDIHTFLALIDGRPVANGQIVWLTNGLPYLGGASTLSEYRGRGAFRALVRARWDEAVARRVPILLVQAGQMSEPILRRLGFQSTGRITILRDRSEL